MTGALLRLYSETNLYTPRSGASAKIPSSHPSSSCSSPGEMFIGKAANAGHPMLPGSKKYNIKTYLKHALATHAKGK